MGWTGGGPFLPLWLFLPVEAVEVDGSHTLIGSGEGGRGRKWQVASRILVEKGVRGKGVVCCAPTASDPFFPLAHSIPHSSPAPQIHIPSSAGGPECLPHPQHPLRPHTAWGPLLCHHCCGYGRSAQRSHLPAAALRTEEGYEPEGGHCTRALASGIVCVYPPPQGGFAGGVSLRQ